MAASASAGEESPAIILNEDALRGRECQLSIQSTQEVVLALMVTLATLSDAPFPLLAVPFLVLLILALFNRPSREFVSAIKERIDLPKNVLLRHTSGASSKLFSVPLMSILFVPRDKLLSFKRPGGIGELYHELGHRRQYDWAAMFWLVLAGTLWLILFSINLPEGIDDLIHLINGTATRNEHGYPLLLAPDGGLYVALMMLALAIIVFASLHRLFHNREYLADVRAALIDHNETLAFLRDGILEDSLESAGSSIWKRLSGALSHPTFEKRYLALTNSPRERTLPTFVHGFVWSLSATTVAVFIGIRNFALDLPQAEAFVSAQISAIMMMFVIGLLICAVGWFMHQTYLRCGYHSPSRVLVAQSAGYGLGFISALMHFPVFRVSSDSEFTMSVQEFWIALSFIPSAVFFWLTLNILTCLALKRSNQQNYLIFIYSFINWSAGLGCAMALLYPAIIEGDEDLVPVLMASGTTIAISVGFAAVINLGVSNLISFVTIFIRHEKRS